MKVYLNQKWEESQTLVDGVYKLLVTPKRLGMKKRRSKNSIRKSPT